MPRRLLHEPHLLAHELRTPLSVLAGWFSLIRDGDIAAERDQARWQTAMDACQLAVDRLNLVIAEACDEASLLNRRSVPQSAQLQELMDATREAIDESEALMERIQGRREPAKSAEVIHSQASRRQVSSGPPL